MEISIIIPTQNHCDDLLKPCVDSIFKYTNWDKIELIISANGCTDNTKYYLDTLKNHLPSLKVVWNENSVGYPAAINQGILKSSGEYIILLNNDILLLNQKHNEWLDFLLTPLRENPSIGITGPLISYSQDANSEFVVFFCAAMRKNLFDEIGMLDEMFSPGFGEDIDFCVKTKDAGYSILQVPSNELLPIENNCGIGKFPIYHKGGSTFAKIDDVQNIVLNNSKELRNRYLKKELPDGFFSQNNINTYRKLAQNVPDNGTIIELGSWMGKSLCSIADIIKSKNISVISVDTFKGTVNEEFLLNQAKQNNIKNEFIKNIKKFGIYDNVKIIEGTTNDSFNSIENKSSDLLFIDADHSYEAVKSDIINWINKVSETGTIAGHDYANDHMGVVNAVDELLENVIVDNGIWLTKNKVIRTGVTVEISTKNRYFTTLPNTIISVANQTFLPKEIIIYDDGDQSDLRKVGLYENIFSLLTKKGISWRVLFGTKLGQVKNHQKAITDAKHEWIWRLDDDDVAEPDVLEKLVNNIQDDVGAISCKILHPNQKISKKICSSKIEDLYDKLNIQWAYDAEKCDVDHFNNSFLFRKKAALHGYCMNLSPVGHREETIFTYEMKRSGWKLIFEPNATIWHMRDNSGGIRSYNNAEYYSSDESYFQQLLKNWDITRAERKYIVLNNGLGDHICFKMVLPKIKEKYKNITLAVCYPEVFADENVDIISVDDASNMGIDIEKQCVYRWMLNNKWEQSITQAYERMHL